MANYYPSDSIIVFPSSNATTDGKLFTEENGRNININIVGTNYVVSPNPGGYDLSFQNNSIQIAEGKAIINGFEVKTSTTASIELPTASDVVSEGEYKDYALLCLHTLFDSLQNLSGSEPIDSVYYCKGIQIGYYSLSDYTANPNQYLLLGGVKPDGTIKENGEKYTRFDPKYITIRIESDSKLPPAQVVSLTEFINNILRGYWVSKAGDNEYGSLLFKSQPTGYDKEGFDHTKEDGLSSSVFGVKVISSDLKRGTIVLKAETETATNIVTQILPGIIGFYKGTYKGDSNTTFDNKIIANNSLPSAAYTKTNLLELQSDGGAIKLVNNAGLSFVVDNNKATHNGVEVGKVIYANSSPQTISDSDTTTKYSNTINYLVDANSNIKTQDTQDSNNYITLSAKNSTATLSSNGGYSAGLVLKTGNQTCKVNTMPTNPNVQNGSNILNLTDNVKIGDFTNTNGNLHVTGYIAAAKSERDLSTIRVPDIANGNGNRPLKAQDLYTEGQTWSATYNDYAEVFRIHEEDKDVIKPGMILAVDMNNPDYYVLADNINNIIVGVVSENPAFCAGGDDCKYGVPVALAGRVKIIMDTSFELGDCVSISCESAGHGAVNNKNTSYVGKIVKVIDNNTAEIIVSLR